MIEELRRFIITAQESNLTRTAGKIFITQSALSQSLMRLEKAIGAKLFVQKGKSLYLTTDGEAVLAMGSKILELWEKMKDPETRRILRPTYTIGMFDNAALRLGTFLQKHIHSESFDLELVISSSSKLMSQLQLGILDLAICVTHTKDIAPKGAILVKSFAEELIPVSSKKFTDPIQDIPFILYNQGANTRKQIDSLFIKNGIKPKIFAESTSTTFMKELAILGCGVALLPESYVKAELSQKILVRQRLPFICNREYGLYLRDQDRITAKDPIVQEIIHNLSLDKIRRNP